MIRSGDHELWRAHMHTGRARAETAAFIEAMRRVAARLHPAMRSAGITFREATARLERSFAALERAGVTARSAHESAHDTPEGPR